MSDYIKREDAKQLFLNHMGNEFPQSIKEQIVEKAFEELPLSADVVEVVRCKDCEHHEELLYNNDGKVLCWVHGLDVVVDGNGYCNYGERKEQEHE